MIGLLISLAMFGSFAGAEQLDFSGHVKETARGAFDETGLWILGTGAAATLIAFQFDNSLKDDWKGHHQMSEDLSRYGDFWGTGIPQSLIIAGQIYFDKENGIPAAEGFIMGGIVIHSTKVIVGRRRPDSETRTSMPSGHTQAAFSIAASMTESYGAVKALPFWAMGVFTGLSRMADNAHWLSDVVAGATIGTLFGRAGYQHHRQIQPTVLFDEGRPDGVGLVLRQDW